MPHTIGHPDLATLSMLCLRVAKPGASCAGHVLVPGKNWPVFPRPPLARVRSLRFCRWADDAGRSPELASCVLQMQTTFALANQNTHRHHPNSQHHDEKATLPRTIRKLFQFCSCSWHRRGSWTGSWLEGIVGLPAWLLARKYEGKGVEP